MSSTVSTTIPSTDRIEKQVTLKAPVARVWRALTDPAEFGQWFGVALRGTFTPGSRITCDWSTMIKADSMQRSLAKAGYPDATVTIPVGEATFCTIEMVEPQTRFSFRWIPFFIDDEADPANEVPTLVEFTLAPAAEGTHLTIVESGFDRVPLRRRERAFRINTGGWSGQSENLRRHVEAH